MGSGGTKFPILVGLKNFPRKVVEKRPLKNGPPLVRSCEPLLLHQVEDHELVDTRYCQPGRAAVAGRQSEWKYE